MEGEPMRIIVPIKQILDPAGVTIRRDKERLFVNREDFVIDPGSLGALEAALRIKDGADAQAKVIALCLGEPRAEDALREAMALGCDAAYLLTDAAFEHADLSVAVTVLAAGIEKLGGADLVLTGRESGDVGSGQIGPRLAQALGYAGVTNVYVLALGNGVTLATRRWGESYASLEVEMPAVLSVAPEAFPIRYAHGARIMNAYRQWGVTVWNSRDLKLNEADLVPLLVSRGESFPPPAEVGERLHGDPASVAAEVITVLKLHNLPG
jgi:electron transfer flavoprotein beta subunit